MSKKTLDQESLEIRELEAHFPTLSAEAFSAAAKRSLAAGESVTQAFGTKVFRISPGGGRVVVKTIPEPLAVEAGSKIRIR
ncbi:hypothetical protein [Haloferula sp. A504]|uniref:hypothetical protein n=1 Tax=Haloferula sp. A504 TaxID=3373601 RepID=UPI0031C2E0F6|nr:hypothetical protein [Verrucomicrobiaceae bacterium E54]